MKLAVIIANRLSGKGKRPAFFGGALFKQLFLLGLAAAILELFAGAAGALVGRFGSHSFHLL